MPASARSSLIRLAALCEQVEALGQIRAALARPFLTTHDIEAVEGALKKLEPTDRTGMIRRFLGCRARLEGHDAAAQRLGVTGDGRAVLRDMKQVEAAEAGKRPPDTPPGLPIPEGPAVRFRPDVREALNADLPLTNELAQTEKAARGKAATLVENEETYQAASARVLAGGWRPNREAPPAANLKVAEPEVDEVVRLLGHAASAAERVLIRHLLESKTPKETASLLTKEGGR